MVHVQENALAAQDEHLPFGDPEFVRNPYPWLVRLRRDRPLHRLPNGTHVVSRYADVVHYGRLKQLTILEPEGAPENAFTANFGDTMLSREGPAHTELRGRTARWFTPPLVRGYAEAAAREVDRALDHYRDGDVIDGHHKLGMIPTHALMCNALDVPVDDPEPAIAAMLDVMRGISSVAVKADDELAAQGFAYLRDRTLALLRWKREHPGNGLADALIAQHDAGEISEEELIQTLSLFWGSGAHNPSYLIGAGLEYFATHTDVWDIYRTQPEKRKAIVTELIRLFPAELSFIRNATEPVEILDTMIPTGTSVRFLINAANRDPDVFPEPDTLRLDRPPKAMPLSFGIGHHACAGAIIARIGAETVFDAVAARVASIAVAAPSTFDATDRSRAFLTQSLRLTLADRPAPVRPSGDRHVQGRP